MKTKFFKSIVTIFFLLCLSTASICLEKEYITDKFSRLDVLATTNRKETINMEKNI